MCAACTELLGTRPSLFTPVLQDHEVRVVPLNPPHLALLHGGHCFALFWYGQNVAPFFESSFEATCCETHCLWIRRKYRFAALPKELLQTTIQQKPPNTPLGIKLCWSSTCPCGASRFCHSFQRCSSFSQRRTSVKWFNFQPVELKEPWTWIQIAQK